MAHALGLKTHCTMLYAHVETYEERIEHLLALRELQDETGGFMAFIPLPFHPENTVFERRGWKFTDRHGRSQDAGRLAADARQHRAREGVLDHDLDAARPGRAPLRCERHPGHGRRGEDRARRRGRHAHRGEGRGARARDPRGRPHPGPARHLLHPRCGRSARWPRRSASAASTSSTPPRSSGASRATSRDGLRPRRSRRPDGAQPHAARRGEIDAGQRAPASSTRATRRSTCCCRRCASARTARSSRCSSSPMCRSSASASSPPPAQSAPSVVLVRTLLPERGDPAPRTRPPTPAC